MDRLLWCESCREAARQRAAWWGWGLGAALAGILAAWIWLVIQPSDLILPGWVATVVAAFWIGGRVIREVVYGVYRFNNRKATDAVPPFTE